MLSSSAFRSLPGHAQILASKHRRPNTWPLGNRDTEQAEPRSKTIHHLTRGMTHNHWGRGQWWQCLLLSSFQSDNDENWASVHSTHAARVAHEVVQNCGEFCPHLRRWMTLKVSDNLRSQWRQTGWGHKCFLLKTSLRQETGDCVYLHNNNLVIVKSVLQASGHW